MLAVHTKQAVTRRYQVVVSKQGRVQCGQCGCVSPQVAHGSEPAFTWPSGIVAPLMDEGDPHCADYIYVWQAAGYELQVRGL